MLDNGAANDGQELPRADTYPKVIFGTLQLDKVSAAQNRLPYLNDRKRLGLDILHPPLDGDHGVGADPFDGERGDGNFSFERMSSLIWMARQLRFRLDPPPNPHSLIRQAASKEFGRSRLLRSRLRRRLKLMKNCNRQ